ncbi:hypothetical protein HY971_02155 [Candidatus Kaiserbacteria bacterium]|nr:hypothetical protein [Candidatus Kaiserbacteria bacterium]
MHVRKTTRVRFVAFVMAAACSLILPETVFAGGSCGYGESAYYAQTLYYAQGTYITKFTTTSSVVGNLTVTGNVYKGAGSFVIDHPLDPANKLLYHSLVEAPEVKNFYDGIATLDKNGEAVVRLPPYFDALNESVRYQLKPYGAPMPNLHVKTEEKNNQFTIGGGAPLGRVSWQVTGIRHDAYILANPNIPEIDKGPDAAVDRGEYLYEGYNNSFVVFFASLWQGVMSNFSSQQ